MSELFFSPIFGVPFVIWVLFLAFYFFNYIPYVLWGAWFFTYLWNPDYMKEVIGEELYDKLT